MKRYKRAGLIVIVVLLVGFGLAALKHFASDDTISAEDAHGYVGEVKTVCGKVVATHYAESDIHKPTLINLDKPYPNDIFTIVILGSRRNLFENPPEVFYRDKKVCVTGSIIDYQGMTLTVVNSPSQIEIK